MADRIRVPRLLSRSRSVWLAVGVAVVVAVAVVVWSLVTQPVAALVVVVVLVLVLGFTAARRTFLDTDDGAVVRDVWGLLPRSTPWAGADVVRIRSNNGGQAMLEVRGTGRRRAIYLPLVAVDLGGDRSQSPEFLRMLADQIERWAPERASVVRELRAQAEHLESGGAVGESPLARAHLRLGRASPEKSQS
ncbi:MAG: hypothetical protein J2P22_18925 [Nocardioides sp.]|nr:hypothetical protein [Nocardioides sp.]